MVKVLSFTVGLAMMIGLRYIMGHSLDILQLIHHGVHSKLVLVSWMVVVYTAIFGPVGRIMHKLSGPSYSTLEKSLWLRFLFSILILTSLYANLEVFLSCSIYYRITVVNGWLPSKSVAIAFTIMAVFLTMAIAVDMMQYAVM